MHPPVRAFVDPRSPRRCNPWIHNHAMTDATHRQFVAVSPQRHSARYWQRFGSYGFARHIHCVDIVMAELAQAASAFPIVFRENDRGNAVEPVALLSFGKTEATPFVAANGKWRGTYVPSALRAHPFAAQPTATAGEMTLLVDETSGLITDNPADQPFFDATGAPAEGLANVIEFFRTRALSATKTNEACTAIQAADLLTPLRSFAGMDQSDLDGLYRVDIEKLDTIADHVLISLWHCGALRLAEAHRVSLCHAGWMLQAERASAGLGQQTPQTSNEPDQAVSGFLDAMSDAQSYDWNTMS